MQPADNPNKDVIESVSRLILKGMKLFLLPACHGEGSTAYPFATKGYPSVVCVDQSESALATESGQSEFSISGGPAASMRDADWLTERDVTHPLIYNLLASL